MAGGEGRVIRITRKWYGSGAVPPDKVVRKGLVTYIYHYVRASSSGYSGSPQVGPSSAPVATSGSSASGWVKQRQRQLRAAGFNVAVDGVWGPASQAAWNAYLRRGGSSGGGGSSGPSTAEARRNELEARVRAEQARIKRQREEIKRRTEKEIARLRVDQARGLARRKAREIRQTMTTASVDPRHAALQLNQDVRKRRVEKFVRAHEAGNKLLAAYAVNQASTEQGRTALRTYGILRRHPEAAKSVRLSDIASIITDPSSLFDPTRPEDVKIVQKWLNAHGAGVAEDGNFGEQTNDALAHAFEVETRRVQRARVAAIADNFYSAGLLHAGAPIPGWFPIHGFVKTPQPGELLALLEKGGFGAAVLIRTLMARGRNSHVEYLNWRHDQLQGMIKSLYGPFETNFGGNPKLRDQIMAMQISLAPIYSGNGEPGSPGQLINTQLTALLSSRNIAEFERKIRTLQKSEERAYLNKQKERAKEDLPWWADALSALARPGELLRQYSVGRIQSLYSDPAGSYFSREGQDAAELVEAGDEWIQAQDWYIRVPFEVVADPINFVPFGGLALGGARASARGIMLTGRGFSHLAAAPGVLGTDFGVAVLRAGRALEEIPDYANYLRTLRGRVSNVLLHPAEDAGLGMRAVSNTFKVARIATVGKAEAMNKAMRRVNLLSRHGFDPNIESKLGKYAADEADKLKAIKIKDAEVRNLLDLTTEEMQGTISTIVPRLINVLVREKASLWAKADRGVESSIGASLFGRLVAEAENREIHNLAAQSARDVRRAYVDKAKAFVPFGGIQEGVEAGANAAARAEYDRVRRAVGSYVKGAGDPELRAIVDDRVFAAYDTIQNVIFPAIQQALEDAAEKGGYKLFDDISGAWIEEHGVTQAVIRHLGARSFGEDKLIPVDNPHFGQLVEVGTAESLARGEIRRRTHRLESFIVRERARGMDYPAEVADRMINDISEEVSNAWVKIPAGKSVRDVLGYGPEDVNAGRLRMTDKRESLRVSSLYARHQDETFAEPRDLSRTVVRDEAGELLPVFHGSGTTFDEFDLSKTRAFESGIFFTDNPDVASGYASIATTRFGEEASAANVQKVYLDIKKPFDMTKTRTAAMDEKLIQAAEKVDPYGPEFPRNRMIEAIYQQLVWSAERHGSEIVEAALRKAATEAYDNRTEDWFVKLVKDAFNSGDVDLLDGNMFRALIKAAGYDGIKVPESASGQLLDAIDPQFQLDADELPYIAWVAFEGKQVVRPKDLARQKADREFEAFLKDDPAVRSLAQLSLPPLMATGGKVDTEIGELLQSITGSHLPDFLDDSTLRDFAPTKKREVERLQGVAKSISRRAVAVARAHDAVMGQALWGERVFWNAMQSAQNRWLRGTYHAVNAGLSLWIFATLPFRPGWVVRNVVDNTAKSFVAGVKDPRAYFFGAATPGHGVKSIFDGDLRAIRYAAHQADRVFGTNVGRKLDDLIETFWEHDFKTINKIMGAHGLPDVPEQWLQDSLFRPYEFGRVKPLKVTQAQVDRSGLEVPDRLVKKPPLTDAQLKARPLLRKAGDEILGWKEGIWELMAARPESYSKRVIFRDTYRKGIKDGLDEFEAYRAAWAKVEKVLFNYDEVTLAEDFLRPIAPFIQFWRKNTAFWVENGIKKPWIPYSVARFEQEMDEMHADQPEWMRRYASLKEASDALSAIPGLGWTVDNALEDAVTDPINFFSFAPLYRAFKGANPNLPVDKAGWKFIAPFVDAMNDWGLSLNPFLRKPLESMGILNYRAWQTVFPQTPLAVALGKTFLRDRWAEIPLDLERIFGLFGEITPREAYENNFNEYVQREMVNQLARGETPDRAAATRVVEDFFLVQTLLGYFGGLYARRLTPEDIYINTIQDEISKGELDYQSLSSHEKQLLKLFKMRGVSRGDFDRYVEILPYIQAFFRQVNFEDREKLKQEHPEIIPFVEPLFTGKPYSGKFVHESSLVLDTEAAFKLYDLIDAVDIDDATWSLAESALVTPELQAFWARNDTAAERRRDFLRGQYYQHLNRVSQTFFAIPGTDFAAQEGFLGDHPELQRYWQANNNRADDFAAILNSTHADLRDGYFEFAEAGDWDGANAYLDAFPFIFDKIEDNQYVEDRQTGRPSGGSGGGSGRENSRGMTQHAKDYLANKVFLDAYFALPKEERTAWLDAGSPAAVAVLAYFKKYGRQHRITRHFGSFASFGGGRGVTNPEFAKRIKFWQIYWSLTPDKRPAFVEKNAERYGIFVYGALGDKERHDQEAAFIRRAIASGLSAKAAHYLYVKPLLDYFFTLTKDQKSFFLRANPEVQEYLDKFSHGSMSGDPKTDKLIEQYFNLPEQSDQRSEFLRKHPEVQRFFDSRSTPAVRAMHRLLEVYFEIPPGKDRERFLQQHPEISEYFDKRAAERDAEKMQGEAFDDADPRLAPFYQFADFEVGGAGAREAERQHRVEKPMEISVRGERQPSVSV